MNDPLDLTGVWYGRYVSNSDAQDNGFIAVIDDSDGGLSGSISEPDDTGDGGIRNATLAGRRTGQAMFFVKQYSGRLTHAVRYAGRIDGEGTLISGTWTLDWLTGVFEMQREKFTEEELEAEIEQEILEPIEPR